MSLTEHATHSGIAAAPAGVLPPGRQAQESLMAVHRTLHALLPSQDVRVYEAGGGSTSYLPPDVLASAHVTLVDRDAVQLANNKYAAVKILGDIQNQDFAPGSFDLIVCYNVIEHLPDVEATLKRFFAGLDRGGVVLIGAPNPWSLAGAVTKYSPHWFHVWFYRHMCGVKTAGLPGQPPFPTFYHRLVAPNALRAFARTRGMRVRYERRYESPRFSEIRRTHPRLARVFDLVCDGIQAVTGFDARQGDYHMVLEKA